MIDRIKQIIDNEKLSMRAFEAKIGMGNGTIGKAIKNNSNIESRWIAPIVENFRQYNPVWIITGEGEMMKSADYIDNTFNTEEDNVKNLEEIRNQVIKVNKLIDVISSQQQNIQEDRAEIKRLKEDIERLMKKKGGTNNNGENASSA